MQCLNRLATHLNYEEMVNFIPFSLALVQAHA